MKKIHFLLAALTLGAMLSGCSSKSYDTPVVQSEAATTASTTTTEKVTDTVTTTTAPETTTEEPTEPVTIPNDDSVTLAFTGDVYFSDSLYGYYQNEGTAGFLSDKVRDTLTNASLYIADHEFVCSDRGELAEYQIYTFRAPANREVIFKEMGADIVTLANNHTLDYGVTALQDTFALLNDLDIDYVGAGNNLEEALKPSVHEINGKSIAVFGSTRFVPQTFWYATETNPGLLTTYESTKYYQIICDAITAAKSQYDYVAIYVHFGDEKSNVVADYQKTVAHGYMDAGADLVVGTHPHVLQGIEFYNGKPIVYSLGNFLFSNYQSDTVVLNVTINDDNSSSVNLLPCSSYVYKTTDVTGDAAQTLLSYIESISFNVSIDDNGNVAEK